VKKETSLFKILWGTLFFSLAFILTCSGWTLEKKFRFQEKTPARLSLLIGALSAKKEGEMAYRGGISYLRDTWTGRLDVCFSPGEEKKKYSARLQLEGKTKEPEVEGELSIYLNWWWRKIEEKENRVYSLFIGEKLKFPYKTYLYAELGIAYPGKEGLFLWGWNFKAGWQIVSWMEISARYGEFLTEENKILDYCQWTFKGELKFTLRRNLLLLGYEKSSVNDPFYLLNMHVPQAWYAFLQIPL